MDVPAEAPPPESDCQPGAAHPRSADAVLGHEEAERSFLEVFNAGRLHHAWLLTGPMGIGKATLAWRIAKFLLTQPVEDGEAGGLFGEVSATAMPDTLDSDTDHPAIRRVLAMSEPRIFVLRRPWDTEKERFKQEIPVDEVRRLKSFFNYAAVDGGRRVVVVDAADDLNTAAANALLKVLEEPPADTVLLLVCHAPSRLLPTIRSRCRRLSLRPLDPENLTRVLERALGADGGDLAALAALADGSAGRALQLHEAGGAEAYRALVAFLSDLPRLDRPAMVKLADSAAARGAEGRFELMLTLTEFFLHRLSTTGATGQPPTEAVAGEVALLSRLAGSPAQGRAWATAAAELLPRARRGRAVNLDPSALLIDMFLGLQSTAAGHPAA